MTEYRVELVRAEGISDQERWARICKAFDLVLSFSLDDDTADLGELGGQTQDGGGTPDSKAGMHGEYTQ